MTPILNAFSAHKTGRLSSFSSQARKIMLPPFSNNSTGYLLSKESSLKFFSTFSSVLLTQLQFFSIFSGTLQTSALGTAISYRYNQVDGTQDILTADKAFCFDAPRLWNRLPIFDGHFHLHTCV